MGRYKGIHFKMRFRDLDHFLLLFLIVSPLLNISCVTANNQYQLHVQQTISVQRGLCVYIPCRFTVAPAKYPSSTASGTWYKESFPGEVFTSQNPTLVPSNNRGRIFFMGDVSKFDCSMSINDVQATDGSKPLLFRLQDDVRSYSYTNYRVQLTVTELKEKPEITPEKTLLAGEEVTLTCQSPGRCNSSAPQITWSDKVQGKEITYNTLYPDGNRTYSSNLTFTPSKEHNQLQLTCNVELGASKVTTSNQIVLNVEYPPIVCVMNNECFQNANIPLIVMEGKSETIKCTVDSNPQSDITWYRGNKVLNRTSSGQALIYNVKNANLSDAGIYQCSANNSHLSNKKNIEIVVHYAPRTPTIKCFMSKDCSDNGHETIYIKEGSSLSLQCSAKSLPEAELTWSNQSNLKNMTREIHLPNILLSDDGLYTCQANNTYGSSNASVTIKVIYGPRTVSGKNSTCTEGGNSIECTCIIQSFPDANIMWKINEKTFNVTAGDINIYTTSKNAETTSNLSVASTQNDVLSIECISSNQYKNLVLHLLSKKSKSSMEMIAAISVVLAVVVILGIAFIILQHYRRRKLKQEGKDKEELTSNSHDVIYSNSNMFCNDPGISQEIPPKNSVKDDGTLYMNCEEVQYASINFAKLKSKARVEKTEPETEYASIRPQ